jgi:CheY-like chemotaxis protein
MTRPSDRPPARILIVDDEPLNVDYLEQELESRGFVTETAADGLEALERVAAAPPDLVLLDVMMPGMDGISALRVLKEDPETRLIPVVLMTALNAVEDRVRGIEAGADDFLSKPVDDRELLARIRTALEVKRAIDETVGELRSTSAHLERYGSQVRDVAVLAIDWRLREAGLRTGR